MEAARRGKFSYSDGFNSIGRLSDSLYAHYSEQIRSGRFSDSDESAVIGVIDSVYEPGDEFRDNNSVIGKRDLLTGADNDKTTQHGIHVSQLISTYSPSAAFRFYRVTQEATNGTPAIYQRHLQQAMGYAHVVDDVDLMNISVGNDHSADNGAPCAMPNEPCKIRDAARKAIDEGICVVAGAGNIGQMDSICCPALCDEVIAVGGSVSKCTARLSADNAMSLNGRMIKPPLACWLENDGESTEVLCSGRGCSIDMSCSEHQRHVKWEGNVPEGDGKPDVYAPAAALMTSDDADHGYINWGTSYATPLVAGAVCEMISGLKDSDVSYSPTVLKREIADNGTELDDGSGPLLNGREAIRAVYDHYGLQFNVSPTSGTNLHSPSSFDTN